MVGRNDGAQIGAKSYRSLIRFRLFLIIWRRRAKWPISNATDAAAGISRSAKLMGCLRNTTIRFKVTASYSTSTVEFL